MTLYILPGVPRQTPTISPPHAAKYSQNTTTIIIKIRLKKGLVENKVLKSVF